LTNAARAANGCSVALKADGKLTNAAQGHSADMAAKNYFSHTGLDGRSPFDRMRDAGYSYSMAAENIAAGQPTPAAVVNGWMNSAGHKANILNCKLTEIGVGVAKGGSYGIYWTQNFGTPR
ncbi:MAG: CAP domain-containing protein, partial [Kineosporiaceae bacterium]|nr:CAP domain-containing protein [Kineosporiaceae bacterium]